MERSGFPETNILRSANPLDELLKIIQNQMRPKILSRLSFWHHG